jgi:hypothetical protein
MMNPGHLISLEANAMWKTKYLLMTLTLMQAIPFARADDTNLLKPTPDFLKRPLPHIDYMSAGFFAQRNKSIEADPPVTNKSDTTELKISTPNSINVMGLHWVTNDQHPALEERLSKDSSVGVHLTRHGATLFAKHSF